MVERRAGSQTGNLTPDHKKSGIDPIPVCAGEVRHTVGKLLRRSTSLLQTSSQSEVWSGSYELPKSKESKLGQFRDSSLGVLRIKAIWMRVRHSNAKNTIWGKVVASPVTHSQVPGWTHLRVQLCRVAESWDSKGVPDFQHYRGVEGRARSPGIRLGRGTKRSSLNLHPRTSHKRLSSHSGHPWVLGQATGILRHKTHHGPDSGEATTFPHIVFFATLHGGYIQMALFPGTPKLESRNYPETVPVGVPGLWELITPDCRVRSQRGLNQSCSPRRDLFNDVSHSQFEGRKEVDSRLLVVGSQIANLTPGPSFGYNLGYRCPNGQCEAIFDICASRTFQWHQEHPNARCFGPCCRALNIWES
jgi:hypothetical protein